VIGDGIRLYDSGAIHFLNVTEITKALELALKYLDGVPHDDTTRNADVAEIKRVLKAVKGQQFPDPPQKGFGSQIKI
jgi:hypothetical protein